MSREIDIAKRAAADMNETSDRLFGENGKFQKVASGLTRAELEQQLREALESLVVAVNTTVRAGIMVEALEQRIRLCEAVAQAAQTHVHELSDCECPSMVVLQAALAALNAAKKETAPS